MQNLALSGAFARGHQISILCGYSEFQNPRPPAPPQLGGVYTQTSDCMLGSCVTTRVGNVGGPCVVRDVGYVGGLIGPATATSPTFQTSSAEVAEILQQSGVPSEVQANAAHSDLNHVPTNSMHSRNTWRPSVPASHQHSSCILGFHSWVPNRERQATLVRQVSAEDVAQAAVGPKPCLKLRHPILSGCDGCGTCKMGTSKVNLLQIDPK